MVEFACKRFLLPLPPASPFIPLFCSRPNDFLDELARKRVLRKLHDIKEHVIESNVLKMPVTEMGLCKY